MGRGGGAVEGVMEANTSGYVLGKQIEKIIYDMRDYLNA